MPLRKTPAKASKKEKRKILDENIYEMLHHPKKSFKTRLKKYSHKAVVRQAVAAALREQDSRKSRRSTRKT